MDISLEFMYFENSNFFCSTHEMAYLGFGTLYIPVPLQTPCIQWVVSGDEYADTWAVESGGTPYPWMVSQWLLYPWTDTQGAPSILQVVPQGAVPLLIPLIGLLLMYRLHGGHLKQSFKGQNHDIHKPPRSLQGKCSSLRPEICRGPRNKIRSTHLRTNCHHYHAFS